MRKARQRRFAKHRKEEKNPFFSGKENLSSLSTSKGGFFQAKLEISDPSEPSEKEADKVADQVVNEAHTNTQKSAFGKKSVQRQEKEKEPAAKRIQRQAEEEEETAAKRIQRQAEKEEEPAAKRIQRQAEEEEEPVQAKRIQRQVEEKEEEPAAKRIQRQAEEEKEPAAKRIQRQAEEEEEPAAKRIQRKAEEEEEPAAKRIQRQTEEEEEPVQAKHIKNDAVNNPVSHTIIQPKPKGNNSKQILESMIQETKGMGMALPNDILIEMEKEFKTDFSMVRIHIGDKAVKMTNMIQALAFTHGYDIYFNVGKYQPYSSTGKMLLAHELTHVVQQKG